MSLFCKLLSDALTILARLISMCRHRSLYANFGSSRTYLSKAYIVIYIVYGAYASEICVTHDGYSRLGFICVGACRGLGAYAPTNKSQLQSQPDTYPKSLPFASGCQQNVCWTRLTMHCRKAGVTCRWRKKDESFQRWFMPANHAGGVDSGRKIINPPRRLFIEMATLRVTRYT